MHTPESRAHVSPAKHNPKRAPTLAVITSTWPRDPQDIAGRFLLDLVAALPLRCEIVCPEHSGKGPPAFAGAPLFPFAHAGLFQGDGALASLADGSVGRLGAVRSVASMLTTALAASRRCDVLFSHWAVPGGLVGALCRRFFGVPHVLLLHSADVFWLEQHRCGPLLAHFIADHCDALCGVSSAVVERFAVLSGRRGQVLGCGVTIDEQATHADPLTDHDPAVGCLSRLVPGKGLRRLVQLADTLPGELRVAGSGSLATEVAGLCAASRRARFDGPLFGADKRRWLAGLSVFAAPFTGMPWGQPEGLPVAVLEAQAAGLPVVAFADALPEELVVDGHNGRLVARGDWAGFAAVLAELLRDVQQRRSLGTQARIDVGAHEIGRVARAWTELFGDVVSRGRSAIRAGPTCGRARQDASLDD